VLDELKDDYTNEMNKAVNVNRGVLSLNKTKHTSTSRVLREPGICWSVGVWRGKYIRTKAYSFK